MASEKSAPATAAAAAPAAPAAASKAQEKSAAPAADKDTKSAPVVSEPVKGTRVFIGNLHFATTADELRKHLEAVVPVLSAEVISYASGRSKGCGLAEFKSQSDVEKVIKQLTNSELGGRKIFIREDREPKGFGKAEGKAAPASAAAAAASSAAAPSKDNAGEAPRGRGRGRGRGGRVRGNRGRGGRFTSEDNAPARPANTDRRNLFVGNLPWATTEAELKQLFGDFGTVVKCVIQQDRSGRSKGFATVAFAKESDAQAAVEGLNDVEVGERKIVVRQDSYAN